MQHPKMRRVVSVAAVAVLANSLMACTQDGAQSAETIKIGLLLPASGAYEQPATDMRDAFELYIESNDGKLGGRNVEISVRDEGADAESAAVAAKQLTHKDNVDVILGGVATPAYISAAYEASDSQLPFIGLGGLAALDEDEVDHDWLWQTSYDPTQSGAAIAPYIKEEVDGPVFAFGPDYEGGYYITGSFTKPFLKLGGKLANPDGKPQWTPWPATTDFSKYFDKVVESGAKAIYAYYAGQPSVDFVTQWAESDAHDIPLYGTYLTEGLALEAQGEAAEGVFTSQNYSPSIDNAANRQFVSKWSAAHPERQTNGFTLSGWDGALLLDQAIASIDKGDKVTPSAINDTIATVGTIDSPRGAWQFSEETHVPIQKWYLNTVIKDGPTLSNVTIKDLATLGG
jgi:branched-chain amino acid transport system substrate-binding protein